MNRLSTSFIDDFLAFLKSLLLDNDLSGDSLEVRKLSSGRAELDLCKNFMLWLDLEEGGFESDGLRRFRLLRYAGEVRKYGDVYFDKIAEITLPSPLERFYDPNVYYIYITFLKLHIK
tara:strand:+ start:115 stop:468 length:354 start_codon:yes stop_codon:yes gene_type:complete